MITLENYREEMINALGRLVKIPSVSADADGIYPFGKPCADALGEVLEIARELGFRTKNLDYYAGVADFSDGEAELGILTHVDVVPADASGWKSDPFSLTERDGKLFARGAIDDKGPTVAVLYALKAIRDSSIKLRKNVRLIFGASEETGSEKDIEHYLSCEKMPPMVFSPDGDFPIITTEKGAIHFTLEKSVLLENIVKLSAGTVKNAVPGTAVATLRGVDIAPDALPSFIEASKENGLLRLICHGKEGHASMPEDTENALTRLISFLLSLELSKTDKTLLRSLSELFPYPDSYGKGLEINAQDKSGPLTCVLTIGNYENGLLSAVCDIRYPVTVTKEAIREKIEQKLNENGFSLALFDGNNPHSVNEDSKLVKALLNSYEQVTGKEGYCRSIGGGTYVHNIEGGVAFGMEFPNEDSRMHGADEFITVDNLIRSAQIYADAIVKLCS